MKLKWAQMTVVGLSLVLFVGGNAGADGGSPGTDALIKQLQNRLDVLEKKVAEQDAYIKSQQQAAQAQENKIKTYEERLSDFDQQLHRETKVPGETGPGLAIGAGGSLIVQGTTNTNANDSKKSDRADVSYSADVTLEKSFGDVNGRAFLHLETGKGIGLEDKLSLYSNVNRDQDNDETVRVTELWYEQLFAGEKAILTFGKLDPTAYFDNNEAANDETTQFLARMFRNNPAIEFPDNAAGLRASYSWTDWLETGYGIFDADADWENIGDNLFHISEVTFKTKFFGQAGHYRFFGWRNGANHTKWLATEKNKETNFGAGLSFDQHVSAPVLVFLRYGWQNPNVYNPSLTATGDLNYSLSQSWSSGVELAGSLWGRQKDVIGLAVGQAIPSLEYKKAGADLDPARQAKREGHVEGYYRLTINDHLAISPDVQYIWNAFGDDVVSDSDPIWVYGTRAQVDF